MSAEYTQFDIFKATPTEFEWRMRSIMNGPCAETVREVSKLTESRKRPSKREMEEIQREFMMCIMSYMAPSNISQESEFKAVMQQFEKNQGILEKNGPQCLEDLRKPIENASKMAPKSSETDAQFATRIAKIQSDGNICGRTRQQLANCKNAQQNDFNIDCFTENHKLQTCTLMSICAQQIMDCLSKNSADSNNPVSSCYDKPQGAVLSCMESTLPKLVDLGQDVIGQGITDSDLNLKKYRDIANEISTSPKAFDPLKATAMEFGNEYAAISMKDCRSEVKEMQSCAEGSFNASKCDLQFQKLGLCLTAHLCAKSFKDCIDKTGSAVRCTSNPPDDLKNCLEKIGEFSAELSEQMQEEEERNSRKGGSSRAAPGRGAQPSRRGAAPPQRSRGGFQSRNDDDDDFDDDEEEEQPRPRRRAPPSRPQQRSRRSRSSRDDDDDYDD